jgi:hypothetical protein
MAKKPADKPPKGWAEERAPLDERARPKPKHRAPLMVAQQKPQAEAALNVLACSTRYWLYGVLLHEMVHQLVSGRDGEPCSISGI